MFCNLNESILDDIPVTSESTMMKHIARCTGTEKPIQCDNRKVFITFQGDWYFLQINLYSGRRCLLALGLRKGIYA
jgi:hypothetical protein